MDLFDPTKVDTEGLLNAADTVDALQKQEQAEKEFREQQALAEQQEEQKPEQKGFFNELGSALGGGVVDTVNDITSIPQRAIDLATGEMAEQGDDYQPTWLQIDEDPFETTTWWGGLIRGAVNFSTLFLSGGLLAKGVGLGLKGAGLALSAPRVAPVVGGAIKGAAADAVALSSLDDNMSSIIISHIPETEAVLGPLAVRDGDHPMMKVVKNMVEGLGIGLVLDALLMGKRGFTVQDPPPKPNLDLPQLPPAGEVSIDSKGNYIVNQGSRSELQTLLERKQTLTTRLSSATSPKRISNLESSIKEIEAEIQSIARKDPEVQVAQRNKSIENQTIERGRMAMGNGEFDGYKNKPIAQRDQGNALSGSSPMKVRQQLDQIDTDPTARNGSTDNIVTPGMAKFAAETGGSERLVKDVVKQMVSSAQYQKMLRTARQKNIPFHQMHELAVIRMQNVIEGRNTTGMTPEEFLSPLTQKMGRTGGELDLEYFPRTEILALDLVIGSLTTQIRDLGRAARDVVGAVDIKAKDSLRDVLKERLVLATSLSRRSRYLWGLEGNKGLGGLTDYNPVEIATKLKNVEDESRESMELLMKLIDSDTSDDVLKAFTEIISSTQGLRTIEDLDAYMRQLMRGSTEKGTGALLREWQSVFINSILSGPKTSVRTAMGNTTNTFLRFTSQALGASLPGARDSATAISSRASLAAAMQAIPEAWQVFHKNLSSYMKNDIATVKTRFGSYTVDDQNWEAMGQWIETRGSVGDKAAYRLMSLARGLNNNSLLTYSTRLMAATDDAFRVIMARARSREQSIRKVLETGADVNDVATIRAIEDDFYGKLLDEDGNIDIRRDKFLEAAYKETTLTTDLSGFSKGLEELMNKHPFTKPFFLFARTGVNGLAMTAKHTPVINRLVKETRAVLKATPENLDSVRMYGINTPAELANAKALVHGRQVIGSTIILGASTMYLGGNLTGNGPADRELRQRWIDSGWKPRSIRIGDMWVSYDAFEPFNAVLAAVADVADNQQLMGDEWVEKNLLSIAFLVGGAAISKTYLSGMNQLMELFSGGYSAERIFANLANNTLPLSSARNELGKLLNPGMVEMNGSIAETLMSRNAFLGSPPKKHDILTGEVLKDWHPLTRAFNMFSPVQFSVDDSPGRQFLIDSNFDLVTSVYSIPGQFGGGTLADFPAARSELQRAIGEQNLLKVFDQLAEDPRIQASMAKMRQDIETGDRGTDPMSYYHNIRIKEIFDKAKIKAFGKILNHPSVRAAMEEQKGRTIRDARNRRDTAPIQEILTIPR